MKELTKVKDSNNRIEISFQVDGVGPHFDANRIDKCSFSVTGLTTAVYAENGTGKTFISRMFALNNGSNGIINSDSYLSFGKEHGMFELKIKRANDSTIVHDYKVDLKKGKEPIVTSTGKAYKYHVFNRDYVINNIESTGYSPDGNITGYILGKENIDVSSEKAQSDRVQEEIEKIIKEIDTEIRNAQKDLKSKRIAATLAEYKSITRDRVLTLKKSEETESYDVLCAQLDKLKSLPDDIPDLVMTTRGIHLDCLNVISDILLMSYTKATFDKEAMELIKRVQADSSFFHAGVMKYEQSSKNVCPFCNQALSEYGIYIINLYKEYFEQQEAQVINEIDKNIDAVKYILKDVKSFIDTYNKMTNLFLQYRGYIPEFGNVSCEEMSEYSTIEIEINAVIKMLEEKKKDIAKTDFMISESINNIVSIKTSIEMIYRKQAELSQKLQKMLLDSDKSRRTLHRRICNAVYDSLVDRCSDKVKRRTILLSELDNLEQSIREKEGASKTSKKELVIKDLVQLLNLFFHEKYTFDENTFGVSFMNESLDRRAKDVLSEGEKSILAFCYYLASTHLLISTEQEYNDLFFYIG